MSILWSELWIITKKIYSEIFIKYWLWISKYSFSTIKTKGLDESWFTKIQIFPFLRRNFWEISNTQFYNREMEEYWLFFDECLQFIHELSSLSMVKHLITKKTRIESRCFVHQQEEEKLWEEIQIKQLVLPNIH